MAPSKCYVCIVLLVAKTLTLSHEEDESGDHKHRVQVELLRVALPRERVGVGRRPILDDPVEAEGHSADEQDLRHDDQQAKAAAGAPGHSVLIVLAVSEREGKKTNVILLQ